MNTNNAAKTPLAAKARSKVLDFIKTHKRLIFFCVYLTFIFAMRVLADEGGGDADAKWNEVMEPVTTWIGRLGGVVIGLGGIMFALGFRNDDADSKTRGLQTMVAGALTMAIAGIIGTIT